MSHNSSLHSSKRLVFDRIELFWRDLEIFQDFFLGEDCFFLVEAEDVRDDISLIDLIDLRKHSVQNILDFFDRGEVITCQTLLILQDVLKI